MKERRRGGDDSMTGAEGVGEERLLPGLTWDTLLELCSLIIRSFLVKAPQAEIKVALNN